jgi:hypothetical protein
MSCSRSPAAFPRRRPGQHRRLLVEEHMARLRHVPWQCSSAVGRSEIGGAAEAGPREEELLHTTNPTRQGRAEQPALRDPRLQGREVTSRQPPHVSPAAREVGVARGGRRAGVDGVITKGRGHLDLGALGGPLVMTPPTHTTVLRRSHLTCWAR